MTHRPTRTRRRAIRRQTTSFLVLMLVGNAVLWTVLDRMFEHRWLLTEGEALALAFVVGGSTAAFWWRRRFG